MKPANEITAALQEEFPRDAIKRREGAKKRWFDYVEGYTVIRRLIKATDNQFDVRVINLDRVGDLVTATVELTIPGLGSRQHIGVQMFKAGSGEDLIKGAVTDGIKKAATLFGVALELYGEDYEAADEPTSEPSKQAPKQQVAKPTATVDTSDESTKELGQRRRDEVAKVASDYDWTLEKATSWLRANRGMTRWSQLSNDDINAMIQMLDGANEFTPPANTGRSEQRPASGERNWIGEINAARSRAELAKVANDLIKTVKDKSHPARVRLDARFKELDAKAAA